MKRKGWETVFAWILLAISAQNIQARPLGEVCSVLLEKAGWSLQGIDFSSTETKLIPRLTGKVVLITRVFFYDDVEAEPNMLSEFDRKKIRQTADARALYGVLEVAREDSIQVREPSGRVVHLQLSDPWQRNQLLKSKAYGMHFLARPALVNRAFEFGPDTAIIHFAKLPTGQTPDYSRFPERIREIQGRHARLRIDITDFSPSTVPQLIFNGEGWVEYDNETHAFYVGNPLALSKETKIELDPKLSYRIIATVY